jgi:hypothetical protein
MKLYEIDPNESNFVLSPFSKSQTPIGSITPIMSRILIKL